MSPSRSRSVQRTVVRCWVLVTLGAFLSGCTVAYKFEADIERYADVFPHGQPKNARSEPFGMAYYNNFFGGVNSLSSVRVPAASEQTWVNVEHLVKLVQEDVDRLDGVEHKNYLFSAVEVHRDIVVSDIRVQHHYAGRALEKHSTWIYRYPRKPDGDIDPKQALLVSRYQADYGYPDDVFVYVVIYKVPSMVSLLHFFLPEFLEYSAQAREVIEIDYVEEGEIRTRRIDVELEWTRREYWVT